MNNLGNIHAIPVFAPIDTASTATEAFCTPVDIGEATELEFDLYAGVVTGDTVVIKVYKDANTTTTGGTAITFRYKLSAATGTDTSAAWTANASTGYTLSAGADNMLLRINVDPADCDGYPYVYIGMDPGALISAFVHSVTALVIPRYNESTPSSMVD